MRFPPGKRCRLDKAWQAVCDGECHDLRKIDGFLKREMVDPGKAVHLIGSRNLYHRVIFGRYIAALERRLYKLKEFIPLCSNSYECGIRVAEVLEGSVKILETDHTAWDAHMSKPLLQLVHEFYRKVFGNVPELEECLEAQLVNIWEFSNGCRYVLQGTRTSGDSDTSCGNSLIHVAINRYLGRTYFCDIDQVVKGDDSVISFKTNTVFPLEQYSECFGFEVKPIWRDDPAEVEFASSIVLPVSKDNQLTFKMFRLPRKVLTRVCYTLGEYSSSGALERFADKVTCELVCNRGAPIIQAFTQYLYRCVRVPSSGRTLDSSEQFRLHLFSGGPSRVEPEARRIFAHKFGIGISDQILCENYLDSLLPGCPIDHPVITALVQ